MKKCIIEGCDKKKHVKLGYCSAHYAKYVKYGDPLAGRWNKYKAGETPEKCTIDGCDAKHDHGGLCQTHYLRKKNLGSPYAKYPSELAPPKICDVAGCDGKYYSKGYCSRHYYTWFKYGDPLYIENNTPLAWLERHTEYEGDDCLIWPHSRLLNGYGTVAHNNKKRIASRVMCELAHGLPPNKKMQAAHSCGNGKGGCVNPKHLRWATVKENANDKIDHGTVLYGENAPWSKLNDEKVKEIIQSDLPIYLLAKKFNVAQATVFNARQGASWKHIHEELQRDNQRMGSKV